MNDPSFPPNPYVIGVPLTGDAGFYGRRDMFDFVADVLGAKHQNVVVFYGQRRVGKPLCFIKLLGNSSRKTTSFPFFLTYRAKSVNRWEKYSMPWPVPSHVP